MTITAEQAAKLHGTLPGVQTDMMNGDCLAVILCSHFCDGEPNPDSENGWSERAEAGYEEVIAAIRAHYDPVIRALIASEAAWKLAEERLSKAVEALAFYADKDAWNQPAVEVLAGEFGPAYRNKASEMQKDRGNRARAILKEIDNG